MSKYRIRFFTDWNTPTECKHSYEWFCRADLIPEYGPDKEIYITDGDDYTHAIVLNTQMPQNINLPKDKVVGLAAEPPQMLEIRPEFREYVKKTMKKYLIGGLYYHKLSEPFVEHFGYLGYNPAYENHPIKTKKMSIMVSDKDFALGHYYRHMLVKSILDSDLDIDIYGRGCSRYEKEYGHDPRLKGSFEGFLKKGPPENEKPIAMYYDYEFHICIENYQTAHYFSEKLINTIGNGCTPIYWGCLNIRKYCPNYIISLNGRLEEDLDMLRDILNNPEKYKKNIPVKEFFDSINFLKNLDFIFS